MDLDRNANGIQGGDEPLAQLQIMASGPNAVVSWPLSAAGFVLEEFPASTGGSWLTATNPVTILSAANYVTNSPAPAAKFLRLRMP